MQRTGMPMNASMHRSMQSTYPEDSVTLFAFELCYDPWFKVMVRRVRRHRRLRSRSAAAAARPRIVDGYGWCSRRRSWDLDWSPPVPGEQNLGTSVLPRRETISIVEIYMDVLWEFVMQIAICRLSTYNRSLLLEFVTVFVIQDQIRFFLMGYTRACSWINWLYACRDRKSVV